MLKIRLLIATILVVIFGAVLHVASREQNTPPPAGAVLLDSAEVKESSGIARSAYLEQRLWTHNDSGDTPRLFAFSTAGQLQAIVQIDGATALDWEDMCAFTQGGQNFLAIADVGDNGLARPHVEIYIVAEPNWSETLTRPVRITCRAQCKVQVRYPGGPYNCEAIAYDPWREQFLLITKDKLQAKIFAIPCDTRQAEQAVTAQPLGQLLLPMVTGACVSDDGQLLVLATYGPSCMLRRTADIDWAGATVDQRRTAGWQTRDPEKLELITAPPRRQGESVCFDKAAKFLYMTSEGSPMPLWQVPVAPLDSADK